MIKVNWDVEELVALVDIYRRSDGKTNEIITEELTALSTMLQNRAEMLGIARDEKYRNLNGMKMMFQNVVFVATNEQQGLSAASSSMRKVYELLTVAPEVFELLLSEFMKHYDKRNR